MTDKEHNQQTLYFDYNSCLNGEEDMGQNVYADYEPSSGPSGDMSFKTEKVPEENPVDDSCINMSYEIENIPDENDVNEYCIILSDNDENVDNDGNLPSELPQEPRDSGDYHNELTFRDEVTLTPNDCNGDADSIEYPQCIGNDVEIQDSYRRKHACFYCGRFYERISIHYLRCHSKKAEVVRVLKTPARSKARKWRWDTLMSKGDSKHEHKANRKKSDKKIQKKRNFNQETGKNVPYLDALVDDTVPEYNEDEGADEQNQTEYQISNVSDNDGKRKTKGRFKGKGTPWSRKEQLAVLKHLSHCVKSGRNPVKKECMAAKAAAPQALKHRTWVMIKHFIRNRRLKLAKKKKNTN